MVYVVTDRAGVGTLHAKNIQPHLACRRNCISHWILLAAAEKYGRSKRNISIGYFSFLPQSLNHQITKSPNRFRLLQRGPRPGSDSRAILLWILRVHIQDRLPPCGFDDHGLAIFRFEFEGALAAVERVLVLLTNKVRRFLLHDEFS